MPNILIAEAGSTKTDWSLLSEDNSDIIRIHTKGINPLLSSQTQIQETIKNLKKSLENFLINHIYFYGAGCVGDSQKNVIREAISFYWPDCFINIQSDIIAAGKALFGEDEGIVGILGTGSNSCYFQNGVVVKQIPPLGYILGDEGSGAALGKKLLNAVFKRNLHEEIIKRFQEEYNLSLQELIENVYRKPMASSYIASFYPFLLKNKDNLQIRRLVVDELENFFIRNILPYHCNPDTKIGFIGSIADANKELLQEIAVKYKFKIHKILKSPIRELEKYYIKSSSPSLNHLKNSL